MVEKLVGVRDLARPRRWIYCASGVLKLCKRDPDFPQPAAVINSKVRVWRLADIERYERRHPELFDPYQRRRKQRGWKVQMGVVEVVANDRPWPWSQAVLGHVVDHPD